MNRAMRWLLPTILATRPFKRLRRVAIPLGLLLARAWPLIRARIGRRPGRA